MDPLQLMRFLNEIIQCLPDILVTASSSIYHLKLTNHSPLLSYALVHPLLLNIKGKVLLVPSPLMCTRALNNFNNVKK